MPDEPDRMPDAGCGWRAKAIGITVANVGMAGAVGGDMTMPRPVVAGETAMITRRCSERRFWLRPSAEINQILLFGRELTSRVAT